MSLMFAIIWFLPGWNSDGKLHDDDICRLKNALHSDSIVVKNWDGRDSWENAVANAGKSAIALTDEITKMNKAQQNDLILVGHSLGAKIVVDIMAELSDRNIPIQKGILLGPAISADDANLRRAVQCSQLIVVRGEDDQVMKYFYPLVSNGKVAIGDKGSNTGSIKEYVVPKNFWSNRHELLPSHNYHMYIEFMEQALLEKKKAMPKNEFSVYWDGGPVKSKINLIRKMINVKKELWSLK